jgi:hypothetical protein
VLKHGTNSNLRKNKYKNCVCFIYLLAKKKKKTDIASKIEMDLRTTTFTFASNFLAVEAIQGQDGRIGSNGKRWGIRDR